MTKAVPVATYKAAQRSVRDAAAQVASCRKAGLAKIASRNGHTLDREDACGAYMDARFWLKTYRERLAEIHPEKNCHLSPAAKRRFEARQDA